MIWRLWFSLTRPRRRRKYIKSALHKAENKIWENEFLKHQLWEVRGGMREQYDWLRERVEGARRKIAERKYQIFYSATGDEVSVNDLPLPPQEIDSLPDSPTEPHRFHKKLRMKQDHKDIAELQRIVDMRQPDLDQQKKNLEGVDQKVNQLDGAIAGLHELKASLWTMLKKL